MFTKETPQDTFFLKKYNKLQRQTAKFRRIACNGDTKPHS